MNRVPFTLHSGDNLLQYPGLDETRNPLARTARDIKTNDIKSPSKLASNSHTTRNIHHSPSELFLKVAPSIKQTKSPTHRPRPVVFSIENFESKENCSFEAKASSATRLTAKKNVSDLNTNKSTAATNSMIVGKSNMSSQVQTHRNKSPQYDVYEAFTHRKPTKIEPSAYGSLILTQKDVKASFSESTKKASMPSSLKLTLDKICKKDSGSTHRVVINSPTADTSKRLIQQKSAKDLGLGLEPKGRAGNVEKNIKNSGAKKKLNTMLVGLTKPTVSHDKNSSRLSARNINSISGTPRHNYSGGYSIDEESETMKKYKKLLGVLKEKDQEIKRLSHDKSELQCTLSIMKDEITSLRKEKAASKNKEDSSLVDSQLEDSRVQSYRNVDKGRPFSPTMIHGIYQKSIIDLSNGDIKPAKLFNKNTQGVSERAGKTWTSSIDNRMIKGRKRSDNGDGSMENMQLGGKSSSYISLEQNMQENSFRQRNENYSQKEKLSYLKEIDEEFEDHHNKKRFNEEMLRVTINISSPSQADNHPKKIRKVQVEKKERDNVSLDDRTLFRNSSTDPKVRSEKLLGKNSGINSSMAYFSVSNTSQGEGMDIGGALNELKDRIKKMLVKRNDEDSAKAQLQYENIYQCLQKIA